MPELPEVQTTVNGLIKKVIGSKIIDVWTDTPKLIKELSFPDFKKNIKNSKVETILRKGKNIILRLDKNRALLIHQKMTGHLLYGRWKQKNQKWEPVSDGPLSDPMNRFIHLIFFLQNGDMLALSDLRKFAKIIFNSQESILNLPEIRKLGPDALEVTFKEFKERIKNKKGKIKQVLMNQEIVSGIGNIYSDEILFGAKINPFKETDKLTEQELKKIFGSTKKILKNAIRLHGESFSDYRTLEGKKGNFDKERKVYRRGGEECFKCGENITREKIGGRSAHFCPKCQKL